MSDEPKDCPAPPCAGIMAAEAFMQPLREEQERYQFHLRQQWGKDIRAVYRVEALNFPRSEGRPIGELIGSIGSQLKEKGYKEQHIDDFMMYVFPTSGKTHLTLDEFFDSYSTALTKSGRLTGVH